MSRLPRLRPEDMMPRQRELYDSFTTGPRANPANPYRLFDDEGFLTGPVSAWVQSAEIGHVLDRFGAQMRWGIHVSDATREAVILAVGYAEDSPFELFAHEPAARAAGLTDDDLVALRAGRVPEGADAELRVAHSLALELIATRGLSDESFERAAAALGLPVVFELVTLVGYYQFVALTLSAFRILPPGAD